MFLVSSVSLFEDKSGFLQLGVIAQIQEHGAWMVMFKIDTVGNNFTLCLSLSNMEKGWITNHGKKGKCFHLKLGQTTDCCNICLSGEVNLLKCDQQHAILRVPTHLTSSVDVKTVSVLFCQWYKKGLQNKRCKFIVQVNKLSNCQESFIFPLQ